MKESSLFYRIFDWFLLIFVVLISILGSFYFFIYFYPASQRTDDVLIFGYTNWIQGSFGMFFVVFGLLTVAKHVHRQSNKLFGVKRPSWLDMKNWSRFGYICLGIGIALFVVQTQLSGQVTAEKVRIHDFPEMKWNEWNWSETEKIVISANPRRGRAGGTRYWALRHSIVLVGGNKRFDISAYVHTMKQSDVEILANLIIQKEIPIEISVLTYEYTLSTLDKNNSQELFTLLLYNSPFRLRDDTVRINTR